MSRQTREVHGAKLRARNVAPCQYAHCIPRLVLPRGVPLAYEEDATLFLAEIKPIQPKEVLGCQGCLQYAWGECQKQRCSFSRVQRDLKRFPNRADQHNHVR